MAALPVQRARRTQSVGALHCSVGGRSWQEEEQQRPSEGEQGAGWEEVWEEVRVQGDRPEGPPVLGRK